MFKIIKVLEDRNAETITPLFGARYIATDKNGDVYAYKKAPYCRGQEESFEAHEDVCIFIGKVIYEGDFRYSIMYLPKSSGSAAYTIYINNHKKCKEVQKYEALIDGKWVTAKEVRRLPNFDWSTVAIDTPIVLDGITKLHFCKYENDKLYAWSSGKTSHTAVSSYRIPTDKTQVYCTE